MQSAKAGRLHNITEGTQEIVGRGIMELWMQAQVSKTASFCICASTQRKNGVDNWSAVLSRSDFVSPCDSIIGFPTIISDITSWYHNRDPEYCLLSEGRNSAHKTPHN